MAHVATEGHRVWIIPWTWLLKFFVGTALTSAYWPLAFGMALSIIAVAVFWWKDWGEAQLLPSDQTNSECFFWHIQALASTKQAYQNWSQTIYLPWIGHSNTTLCKEIRQVIRKGNPKVTPTMIFTTNKAFCGRAKDVSNALEMQCRLWIYVLLWAYIHW